MGAEFTGAEDELVVDLAQLRASAAALHADTHAAMAGLEQVSSGVLAPGFASLGELFGDVGAAGNDMLTAWSAADAALRDRLVGTAERLGASADLYSAVDAGNAASLNLGGEAEKGVL